ncbi:hypothetical protein E2986_12816 [Frieseomelitta varia]|uniref:Apolipoprotein D n=1 Tax=Frieseomelitta varia TaxID=561572 RepID=A0A833RZQ6_9HYME|nr:hypothetical protein E2986_12816 [Frieseomelitta varia]
MIDIQKIELARGRYSSYASIKEILAPIQPTKRGVVAGQRSYLVNVYKRHGLNDVHGRSTVDMFGKIVLILSALALVRGQIPSLGFCPDYIPMANFDMNKFLGIWFEAERYFQLTEVVSRCVMVNYSLGSDGKFRVTNEVTNRFTGIKRVLEGEIKKAASKAEEGKLTVKYSLPLSPETKYSVLETDYDNYAVLWSCSGIGPFRTQNAWVMTRERQAPGTVLQKAYAVLDKYQISKMFFVKTDQEDCAYLEASAAQNDQTSEEAPQRDTENVRTALTSDAAEATLEMKNTKENEKQPQIIENPKKKPINTVPERIMEVADTYLGKWYEIEKYFAFFEFGGKCVTATFNITDDSNSINILNKQISSLTGVSSSIEGVGKPVLKVEEAKLSVSFPSMPLPIDAPYWILDTDYTTYAVVWSCSNFGVFSTRNVWILAREPKPPVSVLEKAYQILDKNNISRAYFIRTDQKNCPIGN